MLTNLVASGLLKTSADRKLEKAHTSVRTTEDIKGPVFPSKVDHLAVGNPHGFSRAKATAGGRILTLIPNIHEPA